MDTYKIKLLSFGYKYGLPKKADMILDMRGLPNPFYVAELKTLSGEDKAVQDYIFSFPVSQEYQLALLRVIELRLKLLRASSDLCIAFGCTGGQHRSVAMLLKTAEALQKEGYTVRIEHRDMDKWVG